MWNFRPEGVKMPSKETSGQITMEKKSMFLIFCFLSNRGYFLGSTRVKTLNEARMFLRKTWLWKHTCEIYTFKAWAATRVSFANPVASPLGDTKQVRSCLASTSSKLTKGMAMIISFS